MNLKLKLLPIVFLGLALALFMSPATTQALPPATYIPGSEGALFDGNVFTDEMWTVEKTFVNETSEDSVEIIMHHVNYEGTGAFHAALLALGDVYENATATNATLPYQLFGMHYTTPTGKEIFIGAVLAYLFAYNDTNRNYLRDPGEDRWILVPFGYNNGNYTGSNPSVSAISVQNPEPGHYTFGVKYENMYCRIVAGDDLLAAWLTLLYPVFEVQISELTFTYDMKVNTTTGEVTTETFYTIGQVQSLYVLGTEVPDPYPAFENVSVGVAHFVTAWGSNYYTAPGDTMPTNATNWLAGAINTDPFGNERAWAVGVRGTYDLINETEPDPPVAENLPAVAWVMSAALIDLLLVAWQLPLSADFLAVWSYAVSPMLQTLYTGPLDLYNHANSAFNKVAFWYAIVFPHFGGYRIEHDPVYTAYSNIGQAPPAPGIPGFPWEAILIGVVVCLVAVFFVRRRRQEA